MNKEILRHAQNVFEKDYVIENGQTDAAGKLTFGTLARFMQDITTAHMEALGITVEGMMEQNLIWVIVCTQINIARLPEYGETVEQYSWPGAEKFGMHSRRYAFFSKEGEELLTASSLFILVNKESRGMNESAKEAVSLPVVVIEEEPGLPKMTQKFPRLMFGKMHEVQESEIDYNGHVNNAVYLDWADSIFETDFVKSRETRGIWLQYDKEILPGQKVAMIFASSEDSAYMKGCVEGAETFKVRFDF